VRVLAETAIRLPNKAIDFVPVFRLCFGMPDWNPKPDRKRRFADWMYESFVSASEVARYSDFISESTVRRWMKNRKTSFGMSLDVSVKDDHLVIPLYQAHLIEEELERQEQGKFMRASEELEPYLKSGVPVSRPRKPKLKSPGP
jgi:hypothetical protein